MALRFTLSSLLALTLLLSHPLTFSQSNFDKFRKLSRPEKRWVVFHPFVAKKAMKITNQVILTLDTLRGKAQLGYDLNGGKLDAFKHSYWMALLASHIGSRKAYKLGIAHEKGNKLEFKQHKLEDNILPDSVSCAMDLWNNRQGIAVAKELRTKSTLKIQVELIKAIRAGHMMVIRKDDKGNYLDCQGNLIDLAAWKGKWGIPKCLTPSN